jgi:phage gpG-like protein
MAVKVRIKRDINLKKQLADASREATREIKKDIVDLIIDDYDRGISPVKGTNQFAQYAKSTAKKKGRRRPVTIEETGKLKKSLKAVQRQKNQKGVITVFFNGARNQKIAAFLQFGTSKMKAKRPLLPARNQTFKKRIIDAINSIINKNIKKFVK